MAACLDFSEPAKSTRLISDCIISGGFPGVGFWVIFLKLFWIKKKINLNSDGHLDFDEFEAFLKVLFSYKSVPYQISKNRIKDLMNYFNPVQVTNFKKVQTSSFFLSKL